MEEQRMHRLNIRLSQKEWEKVRRLYANSTSRSISEYARKLLTNQPVTQLFRNPPLEELASRLPPLLDYMTSVGNSAMSTNPDFLATYGNTVEIAEDIRTLLIKLSEGCDPK